MEEDFNNLVDKAFDEWEKALQRLTFNKIYPGDYLHSLFGPNIYIQQVNSLDYLKGTIDLDEGLILRADSKLWDMVTL